MTRRPQALFLVALVGVLLCVGLGLHALAGGLVATVYGAVVLVLLVVGAARARRARTPLPALAPEGRSCTCCTTSQHDPVKVV